MSLNLYPILLNSLLDVLIMLWPIYIVVSLLIIRKVYYFIKLKKAGMYEIDRMSGGEFEVFLVSFFKKLDYQVKRVGSSKGDYGADLIISKNNLSIAVQAKRHNSSIGVDAVREVLGSLKIYNCSNGIVITNNYFTNQAKLLAKVNNIKLWDRNYLMQKIISQK